MMKPQNLTTKQLLALSFSGLLTLSALSVSLPLQGAIAQEVNEETRFDPETGEGFVSRGDVQSSLDLSKAQMQQWASQIFFVTNTRTEYQITCASEPEPVTIEYTSETKTRVDSTVLENKRHHTTGFVLLGLGESNVFDHYVPEIGDRCPNIGSPITNIEEISSSNSGLTAVLMGTAAVIL